MFQPRALTAVLSLYVSLAWTEQNETRGSGRQFSLLSIFSFRNSECVAGLDGTLGECYTAQECQARGGTSSTTCASGIGVCCYIVQNSFQADNEIIYNSTYVRSPGYTDGYSTPGTSTHRIVPINANICQFRLDFQSLDLVKPITGTGTDGGCDTDTLTLTEGVDMSSHNYPPVYCGLGTGQHLYLQAHPGRDLAASIEFNLGASSYERKWSIRVTQIECGERWTPPANCLQYFTGLTGSVSSWNYEDTNYIHTNNQDYAVCLRREQGYCGVSWTQDSSPNSFGVDGGKTKGRGGGLCRTDWVAIPGGSLTGRGASLERWCGAVFGAISTASLLEHGTMITTYQTPFRMFVSFNQNTNSMDAARRGFKLNYRQISC